MPPVPLPPCGILDASARQRRRRSGGNRGLNFVEARAASPAFICSVAPHSFPLSPHAFSPPLPPRQKQGWVEFADKRVAKTVAAALNGQPVGGKRFSAHHHDLWAMKYLPKFKWEHLSEEIAYEKARGREGGGVGGNYRDRPCPRLQKWSLSPPLHFSSRLLSSSPRTTA